jgi:hypothetical protein
VDKEQSAVPDSKAGNSVANSESVVKGPTVRQSDTKSLTVKGSEGDDGNVEDPEGEGSELEDSELEDSKEGWEDEDSDIDSSDEEDSEMHDSDVGGHSIEDIDFANMEFDEIMAMLDEEDVNNSWKVSSLRCPSRSSSDSSEISQSPLTMEVSLFPHTIPPMFSPPFVPQQNPRH